MIVISIIYTKSMHSRLPLISVRGAMWFHEVDPTLSQHQLVHHNSRGHGDWLQKKHMAQGGPIRAGLPPLSKTIGRMCCLSF